MGDNLRSLKSMREPQKKQDSLDSFFHEGSRVLVLPLTRPSAEIQKCRVSNKAEASLYLPFSAALGLLHYDGALFP